MMGVLLGGIILLFTAWDSPKLLRSPYLSAGLLLGIIPAIAWYCLQYFHYGAQFLGISLGEQTFKRIWAPVSTISGPPWYYLLEIAKYSLPWLIFLPHGVKLAWVNRNFSWGKLTLVWTGIYLLAISLMKTKLPWYVIPLYPGLSLLIGVSLSTRNKRLTFGRYP
jgi:4-amino-4-deoxy-L-arabinose transferase-like glycosyltransferase